MSPPPIPQRIPPLAWRNPAIVWTPLALALAICWPALLFTDSPNLQRAALVLGAVMFTAALLTLCASWALGRAPRTRRIVILHVIVASVFVMFSASFLASDLFANTKSYDLTAALAMTPLILLLGLPIAFVSAILFAWLALTPPRSPRQRLDVRDVQPFQ